MRSKIIARSLLEWYRRSARDLPWRRTRDPYAIWVSEIMLQQTQVKTVVAYWERWMKALPTIAALASSKPETIHKLWEGLGYYTRVRNMQKAASLVMEKHAGLFPSGFEQVLELPGIGRYTAGAVCSIAFNQPCPVLDGNVMRVLARVFGIDGDPRNREVNRELWTLAGELVRNANALSRSTAKHLHANGNEDRPFCSHLNQSLMELGALICTPREPKCDACPLGRQCIAREEGRTGELPALAPRVATTKRRFVAFVAEQRGRFLVRQRPAGVINAHLWEFPNIEVFANEGDPKVAGRKALGFKPVALTSLHSIHHSITRYRIRMDVYRASPPKTRMRRSCGRWLGKEELEQLAFASAHKTILERL